MNNVAFMRNIGAFCKAVLALTSTLATAGGAGDATAANGTTLNRNLYDGLILSAKYVIHATTVGVSGGDTVTVAYKIEDSADGSDWADFDSGGSLEIDDASENVIEYDVNLAGARQYVRLVVTPSLSAADTDTVRVGAVAVFGATVKPIALV